MTINNSNIYSSGYVNTSQSLERIATGLSINQAADNASGLAISENLNVQASGLAQSIENVNSSIAYLQIGDKAISEQSNILDQVKENLLQASTGTTSQEGREALLDDIQKLLTQFDNIASSTNYNGENLLQKAADDQTVSDGLQVQAGENSTDLIESNGIQANSLGTGLTGLLNQDPTTFDAATARAYLEDVDNAVTQLNDFRSEFGATSGQLQSASRNLGSQYTNTQSAQSVISNIDYSKEVSNFSKQNILAQIGAYGQVQSNNITQQAVLRLLT